MRFIYLFIVMVLYSCTSSSVNEDMKVYCDCINEKGSTNLECMEIGEEIVVKYEYDQEAANYIEEEIKRCSENK